MKKKQKTSKKQKATNVRFPEGNKGVDTSKRNFLDKAKTWGLGALVLGGAGYFVVDQVQGSIHEHDLDRVGKGTPAVVQIHDPQCPLCTALQKETRHALGRVEGDLEYVVANIKSNKGRSFAARYGVPHVTLLLFDGKGELQQTLTGQRGSVELQTAFRRLIEEQS